VQLPRTLLEKAAPRAVSSLDAVLSAPALRNERPRTTKRQTNPKVHPPKAVHRPELT